MFDMYLLAIATQLMQNKPMSWDELAATCERPSLLWRVWRALRVLWTLARVRFPRARGFPDPCDRSESAGQCQAAA